MLGLRRRELVELRAVLSLRRREVGLRAGDLFEPIALPELGGRDTRQHPVDRLNDVVQLADLAGEIPRRAHKRGSLTSPRPRAKRPASGPGGISLAYDVLTACGQPVPRPAEEKISAEVAGWHAVPGWMHADQVKQVIVLRAHRSTRPGWQQPVRLRARTGTELVLVQHEADGIGHRVVTQPSRLTSRQSAPQVPEGAADTPCPTLSPAVGLGGHRTIDPKPTFSETYQTLARFALSVRGSGG